MAINVVYNPVSSAGAAAFQAGAGKRRLEDEREAQRRKEVEQERRDRFSLMQLQAQLESQSMLQRAGLAQQASGVDQQNRMEMLQAQLAAGKEQDAARLALSKEENAARLAAAKERDAARFAAGQAAADAAAVRALEMKDIEMRMESDYQRLMRDEGYIRDRNFIEASDALTIEQKTQAVAELTTRYAGLKQVPEGPSFAESYEKNHVTLPDGRIVVPEGMKIVMPTKSQAMTMNQYAAIRATLIKNLTTEENGVQTPPDPARVEAEIQAVMAGYEAFMRSQQAVSEPGGLDGMGGTPPPSAGQPGGPPVGDGSQPDPAQAERQQARQAFLQQVTEYSARIQQASRDPKRIEPSKQAIVDQVVAGANMILRNPNASQADVEKAMAALDRMGMWLGVDFQ